jgi:HlyD family secretion protein
MLLPSSLSRRYAPSELTMKVFRWLFVGLLVLIIGWAFFYLYKKSQAKPVIYQTEQPEKTDITKKTVATGSIIPRQSVDVKPKVTGVIAELSAEPDKPVKIGDALAKVMIIPDAQAMNQADSGVRTAQIALENAKRELDREENLFKQGVVAEAELYKFRTDYAMAKTQLDTASSNLQLVKEGATRNQGKSSTLIVTATASGTVIDVPVKLGYSVIQANSFNPGTTIATIADMTDMIFDGRVDEGEVAKIAKGNRLSIKVGAIEKERFEGTLEFIAPQGKEIDGAIQFEIKAAIKQKPNIYIRAGYSANADIVLDEKKDVLAIREALVQYENTKPYVEIETQPQTFIRKDVTLGLSDGIKVEVVSGVSLGDKIKIPDNAGPPGMEGSGSGSGSNAGSNRPPRK